MQYSLNVQNIEGRVDTCVGCRIVEYLLSTVFLLCIGLQPQANTWVRAFYYNNINRPGGAMYDLRIEVFAAACLVSAIVGS